MKTLKIEIEGLTAIMLHSPRLANPLDPETKAHKEVSGKRKKTDEDYEWLAKHEWLMSLYLDEDQNVIIPSTVIEGVFIAGAKDFRKGIQFKSSLMVMNDARLKNSKSGKYYTLKSIENKPEFIDVRSVVVAGKRIMRCRPIFSLWSIEFEVVFLEESINENEVTQALEIGGKYKGIGDYRPKFGRFSVTKFN